MEKFLDRGITGKSELSQWMAEAAHDPETITTSVKEYLKQQRAPLSGRTRAISIGSGFAPESVSRVTEGVKEALKSLRQEEKEFLMTSPAVQNYLIEKVGKSYKDWKELSALEEGKAAAIGTAISEGMQDASWRKAAKDMKSEAMELDDGVFLVRETFTSLSSTGREQPLSGKFYLVKTG